MYSFSESNIQGMGVFATQDISPGRRVALYYSFLGEVSQTEGGGRRYQRTDFCRFANHGAFPNVELVEDANSCFSAYCIKPIKNKEEILINYPNAAAKVYPRLRSSGEIISEVLRCTPGYENMTIPPDNTDMGTNLIEEAENFSQDDRYAQAIAGASNE